LKFKCTGCGKCCTGAPGFVWVSEKEVEEMAAHVQLPVDEFKRRYIRIVFGRMSLTENKATYDCVFLKNKQCTLYSSRPLQCRQFPWWPQNLENEKTWKETAKECEGIDHADAPLIPYETIKAISEQ